MEYLLYLLWAMCYGIFVVDFLLWNICCGIFVVEKLLWSIFVFAEDHGLRNICCWIFVVGSSFLNSRCGVVVVFVVASLLWNLCI